MRPADLLTLLQQCQDDTFVVIGAGAAGRLSHWQEYQSDLTRLVRFIQERLRKESGRVLVHVGHSVSRKDDFRSQRYVQQAF